MKRSDIQEATRLLREVLAMIDDGSLTVDGPVAAGVVRRLEGALLALELAAK